MRILFAAIFLLINGFLCASNDRFAKTNGIDICYDTFGEESDPPILLIMGALSQSILWPSEFCEQLANEGFYVIRYDHRDSGYSTCFDYEKNPYNLLDMAKDAIGILDYLGIPKAHLCGLSMGGPIAEIMSVYFPDRVSTLTLMATSCDFRPSLLAEDSFSEDIKVSRPRQIYLDWIHKSLQAPPKTIEETLQSRMECWHILNGFVVSFEEQRYREIHSEFLVRLKHPENSLNHLNAIKRSFDLIQAIPHLVKVPTLIFHGSEDPIFPPDHGEALAKAIRHSKFVFLEGMGHVPNCHFYDLWISGIKHHVNGD